jgi:tetratricopeptide (TPR) repeat protein
MSAVDELFPLLEQAGWKEELDALYKDQHVKLQALCKQYPNSARLSNSLAWMSAVARRDLDEALAQARRTLELAPDVASYLDTLAEVHFARGEYQQAVDVQRRAVEVADDKALYEERLKRFEAALAR